MKNKIFTILMVFVVVFLSLPIYAQDGIDSVPKEQEVKKKKKVRKPISYENAPYRKEWKESKVDYQKRLKWWKEAKFGLFIHFGLYSQLGGVWKGEPQPRYAEWIMSTAMISREEYAEQIKTFNPKDFDADGIAKLAKQAGMKYLVITTKHHEGFCLWDSKYTDFDVASSPYGKDIIMELKKACDKHGLKFGTYYSILDWAHPSHELPKVKSYKRPTMVEPAEKSKKEYVTYMKNQIKELIENYDSDIMWFDGDWSYWWTMEDGLDLYHYIRSLKPSILINNRVAKRRQFEFDFGTAEQFKIDTKVDYEWESCYTLNHSWGYKKADNEWKTAETVLRMKEQINSKGGNFLLNIGPDGDGNVPPKSIEILEEVGKQLQGN